VDVFTRLAVSLSAFYFVFDLPLSCLAMAEGTAAVVQAGANPMANWWHMMATQHAVLAAYKLHKEAAHVFARNLGRISTCSLFYYYLVLNHISSQLEHALDMPLEMYMSAAVHKRCAVIQMCWDPKGEARSKLRHLLDRLKRMLHWWLVEPNISDPLRVNAKAILNLGPLFEASPQRLLKTDVLPAIPRDEHTWSWVFVEAHCTLGSEDNKDKDVFAPGDAASLMHLALRTTFCMVVLLLGALTSNDRFSYIEFVKRAMADPRGPVTDCLSNTWWRKSRATADQMFAILTFFTLWQGPTQADAFWLTWVGNTSPPRRQCS
jgi:hypothetical protein